MIEFTLFYLPSVVLNLILSVAPSLTVLAILFYLIGLPIRRLERERFILHLLETGINQGRTPEDIITAAAHSGDKSLHKTFWRLAARIDAGDTFIRAIETVKQVVSPTIKSMLIAGAEIGNFSKIIPATRRVFNDIDGTMRKSRDYMLVLLFIASPFSAGVLLTLQIYIFPKLKAIFEDFEMTEWFPWLMAALMEWAPYLIIFQLLLLFIVWWAIGQQLYVPKNPTRLGLSVSHWIAYRLPWRRKRMQRDFAAALCPLLEADVPEDRAVTLAAQCAANIPFAQQANKAVDQLRNGVPLTEAVRGIDKSGQLAWRLANTRHGSESSFTRALEGWQEELDARAFQQEQVATHIITSGLVIWNGIIVAFITGAVLQMLASVTLQVAM